MGPGCAKILALARTTLTSAHPQNATTARHFQQKPPLNRRPYDPKSCNNLTATYAPNRTRTGRDKCAKQLTILRPKDAQIAFLVCFFSTPGHPISEVRAWGVGPGAATPPLVMASLSAGPFLAPAVFTSGTAHLPRLRGGRCMAAHRNRLDRGGQFG